MTKINAAIIYQPNANYPTVPPFHPAKGFPELPYPETADSDNDAFLLVRELFECLELDINNLHSKKWNPLGEIIRSGDKVCIKPNLVYHSNILGFSNNAVITHGSIIRAIIDYVIIALKGEGEIIVADSPVANCNFEALLKSSGLDTVCQFMNKKLMNTKIRFSIIDLRLEGVEYKHGCIWKRTSLYGDPLGYKIVDMGSKSMLAQIKCDGLYGADYNRDEVRNAHADGKHLYHISNTLLSSDVVISIPKLKVHSKVGVTLNIKNMVGICGNKNFIPHYRVGSPDLEGDEFSEKSIFFMLDRMLKNLLLSRHISLCKYLYALWFYIRQRLWKYAHRGIHHNGNWKGNDTAWRMAVDLNTIIAYADNNGVLHKKPQRKYFSIIDGIIGGEKQGPVGPSPVKSGLLIGGYDPYLTDCIAICLMGLNVEKLPLYQEFLKTHDSLTYINLKLPDRNQNFMFKTLNVNTFEKLFRDSNYTLHRFEPPKGWKHYLEI